MEIFPTAYFGSIAYFRELAKYSDVSIECKEHFPKQSYRNRCDIVGANGVLSLSVPVIRHSGSHTPIDEVTISTDKGWRNDHWRSITSAYQSAPYFEHYNEEIEALLFQDTEGLIDFNQKITQTLLNWVDIDINFSKTSDFAPMQEIDRRALLVSKKMFQETLKAPYIQVFPTDKSYHEGLSFLDAVLCLGPMARNLIVKS